MQEEYRWRTNSVKFVAQYELLQVLGQRGTPLWTPVSCTSPEQGYATLNVNYQFNKKLY